MSYFFSKRKYVKIAASYTYHKRLTVHLLVSCFNLFTPRRKQIKQEKKKKEENNHGSRIKSKWLNTNIPTFKITILTESEIIDSFWQANVSDGLSTREVVWKTNCKKQRPKQNKKN